MIIINKCSINIIRIINIEITLINTVEIKVGSTKIKINIKGGDTITREEVEVIIVYN